MVKADPKKDYYADLEVSSTADIEDIKKQFRLLAKLYHPDRNRGHEVEFVDKFQAIQAANEILSDPNERAKYDTARAKQQQRASAPPPPKDDPYGFRRPPPPSRTQTSGPVPQSTPQARSRPPRPNFGMPQSREREPRDAPSSNAERFAQFARGQPAQTWTKERYEEAARAEALRGFSTMRSQPPPQPAPQMPPRPQQRPHPTAPRPPSAGAAAPEAPYAQPAPFAGMNRTNSRRRQPYPEEVPQQRSAYSYVQARRPPAATASHAAEAYVPVSPQQAKAAASPLRHSRSTEHSMRPDRPQLYARTDGRYSSNAREKPDIKGPHLHRSASVRNSPVDPKFGDENTGSFGRSRTQQPPPPRHHSASPNMRTTSFSSSESEGENLHVRNAKTAPQARPKAQPRAPRLQTRANDGLEGSFPSTNYTKVEDISEGYVYPPPLAKQPTRHPFPNLTSPNEAHQETSPFRYALTRAFGKGPSVNGLPSWAVPSSVSISNTNFGSTELRGSSEHKGSNPENVFRPANFFHENWAEKLKSTSPVKRGSKSKRPPMSKSDTLPDDAMDVDDNSTPQSNGINLDELKNEAPFKSEGLNGVDDLRHNLPSDPKASARVHIDPRRNSSRLKPHDLPQPPKAISAPSLDRLSDENWKYYVRMMGEYIKRWDLFEGKMIEHFRSRREQLHSSMNENWISMPSDGPQAEKVDHTNYSGMSNGAGGLKAGYGAYMEWLNDDEACHEWWAAACERHRNFMRELGLVRDKIMGNQETV